MCFFVFLSLQENFFLTFLLSLLRDLERLKSDTLGCSTQLADVWIRPSSLEHSVFLDAGCGVFVEFCVCVCSLVAIPATVWCWCCSFFIGPRLVFRGWLAMVSRLRRGVRGSRGKSVQQESWRVRSRLMGERSGRVHSAQSRMCGRGGVAGAATMTSQQVCVGCTGRRSPQGLENRLRALRRQAGRKTESPKVWRQKNKRSLGLGVRQEGEGAQGGQGLQSRRESGMEEEWRTDMDLEDEVESRKKLDEQKRKLQKELRNIEKVLVCAERVSGKLSDGEEERKKEKKGRKSDKRPRNETSLGEVWKIALSSLCFFNAAAEGSQKRTVMMKRWQQQQGQVKGSI